MTYNKEDAQMTKGLGILCMLILHLFCRKDAAVFGTPLLWINESTPFVYTFGFFARHVDLSFLVLPTGVFPLVRVAATRVIDISIASVLFGYFCSILLNAFCKSSKPKVASSLAIVFLGVKILCCCFVLFGSHNLKLLMSAVKVEN